MFFQGKHKSVEEMTDFERANLKEAIESLHELKIIHNDLRRENVIFGDDGQVYIIDYGLAVLSHKTKISIEEEQRLSFAQLFGK